MNTANEMDLIRLFEGFNIVLTFSRYLHNCQESPQRDYFLFLIYLRGGKFACKAKIDLF